MVRRSTPPRWRIRSGIAIATLVVVLLALAAHGRGATAARPAASQEWMTTWIWHYVDRDAPIRVPVFRQLLEVAPMDVEVVVASVDDAASARARSSLGDQTRAGRPIHYISTTVPLGSWPRDPYVYFERGHHSCALLPPRHGVTVETAANSAVPLALAARWPGLETREERFALEGGDVFVTDRRVFVGAATLDKNRRHLRIAPEDLLRRIAAVMGRRPIVVGHGGEELLHEHADMFLTPLDDRTVVLGDPRLALGQLPAIAADPEEGAALRALGRYRRSRQLQLIPRYERVASELRAQGIEVRRLPILHGEGNGTGDDQVVLTWNNVLLHHSQGVRHAFVPQYGVRRLDAEAEARWRSWGYVVHAIDMRTTIAHGGAVRCMTNVVRRPFPPDR